MARWFDTIFGRRSRALALARSAELRGDLARAAVLFARAGRLDEANRVRRKRALSILASAIEAPLAACGRPELMEAGADFEAAGEYARAAEAYGYAGDVGAQTRALSQAGEVERVDALLGAEYAREHEARTRRQAQAEFATLVASGQRRDAVDLARGSSDDSLRARGRALEELRVDGPVVETTMSGRRTAVVLGDSVVLGRAPELDGRDPRVGTITVASAALSRRHVSIARRDGEIVVMDLASHNGTFVAGARVEGELRVGEGIELRLGGQVPLAVRPADDLPRAVAIEVAGVRYVAPLGQAMLGVGRWRLERGSARDAATWVELVTENEPPAYADGLRLVERVTLLAGDAISTERAGAVAIAFGPRGG